MGVTVTLSTILIACAGRVLLSTLCYAHPLPTFMAKFPHRKADIQHLSFRVWLSALGQCSPASGIPLQVSWPRSLCTGRIEGEFIWLSVHSSVIRNIPHGSCDQREKINPDTQVSLLCTCFILSGQIPCRGRAVSYGRSIFNFLKNLHSVSCVAIPICISACSVQSFFLCTSFRHLLYLVLFW